MSNTGLEMAQSKRILREALPEVWRAYDDDELFAFVCLSIEKHGISPSEVLFTAIDVIDNPSPDGWLPGEQTFAVSAREWLLSIEDSQRGENPICYVEDDSIKPGRHVYDMNQLAHPQDDRPGLIPVPVLYRHKSSENIQEALLGTFVFKK